MRRLQALPLVGLVILLAAGPARAGDSLSIESVDTSEFPAVSLVVSVPSAAGDPELAADDFVVTVDGARVSAEVFALVRDPIEIAIVLDTSGSMAGQPIEEARAAALGFVDQMPDSASFGVVAFGDQPTLVAPMGSARGDIAGALASLGADGDTALYDAVLMAADLFTDSESRKAMVVLTDGGDTVSQATLGEAADAVDSAGVEVQAVALSTPDTDTGALRLLDTDGSVIQATAAADLAAAYETVARELTGRYRLQFNASGSGTAEIVVFVDTAAGAVSASTSVERSAPGSGSAVTSAPQEGGPMTAPVGEAPVAVVTPGLANQPWTLPAGVALVFVGALAAMWLSLRGRDVDKVDAVDVGPVQVAIDEGKGGWLARTAVSFKSVGDRVATRSGEGAMDLMLDRAGVALRPGEFVVVAATGTVVGVTAGLVLGGAPGAVVLGAAAAAAPKLVLTIMTERRRSAFADQLEGTLAILAGSLRAGYGLAQAISTVATESPSPTAEEFNRVVVENRVGRPVDDAMGALADRMGNEDLRWVVEAIEIQHEVGGNLAEVLDTVSQTIRDRNQIRRQAKALSAEGRMSAMILIGLPFVIAGLIAVISPDYLAELTGTTLGRVMIGAASILMVLGALWLKKIVKVEF